MYLGKTKERVKSLLVNKPKNRDNFNALLANIWNKDIIAKGLNPGSITGREVLEMMAKGELSSPGSIERNWRKIQQDNPELGGELYDERHKKRQVEVKADIRDYDTLQ